MLSATEISRSIRGAAVLFLGRADGLEALDRSIDGFWRSFAVIVLVMPFNAVTMLAIARTQPGETFGGLFLGQLPAVVADWVAFPVVLALLSRSLGTSAHFVTYVVARNWAAPVMAAILTIPFLLFGAGWIPWDGYTVLSLITLILALRYHYVILRLALKTPISTSIGLVIADLLLTLLIVNLLG